MPSAEALKAMASMPKKRRRFLAGKAPSPAEERAEWEASIEDRPIPGVRVEPGEIAGIAVEAHEPEAGPPPAAAVLYFHGGGFVAGSLRTHRAFCSTLALRSGARVVAVDYPLAPEARFPAPEEAAMAVASAVAARIAREGGRLFVGGDSAGGCLAVAAAVSLAREAAGRGAGAGAAAPAGLFLLSPWLDLELEGATMDALDADDPMIFREDLARCADFYCAPAERARASALGRAAALGRAPCPLYVDVGTREVLLDDSRRVAAEWGSLGGRTVLIEREGLWHAYQLWLGAVPEADRAVDELSAWLRETAAS